MTTKWQERKARSFGIELNKEYAGNNGARVIATSIEEHAFGDPLVAYRVSHPDMEGGAWAQGDKSPNSFCNFVGIP